jgi:hypothetical protein
VVAIPSNLRAAIGALRIGFDRLLPSPLMPTLRFRSKLILAMTLVVLGVTTVMLVVTRDRIQEAYAKVFSDQFQTQLDFVTERQQQRLEELADVCVSRRLNPPRSSRLSRARIPDLLPRRRRRKSFAWRRPRRHICQTRRLACYKDCCPRCPQSPVSWCQRIQRRRAAAPCAGC